MTHTPSWPTTGLPLGCDDAEIDAATMEQPTPNGNGVDVAALVHRDIELRADVGRKKYGERLQPHNGRDALVDLYQELLDAACYARQAIFERDGA